MKLKNTLFVTAPLLFLNYFEKCVCCLIVLLFAIIPVHAQKAEALFPSKNLMPVGAYYYPEHWDRGEWGRDLKRMSELGFSFTHMAEFAWAILEPEEGKFNFEWLDWCIAEAAKNGLKVILCTPSPCPPAWLTTARPEVLIVNDMGIKLAHGGDRLFANQSNPVYKKYIERIVAEMGKRYGNDTRVWGWQIDNEPHLASLYDYSPFAQADFRAWLQKKYNNNIQQLNTAWGNAFWSGTYNNFDQIRIANEKESSGNPHALLDFKRYTADALASAIRFQSELLRKNITAKQWITTNFAYYKFLPTVDLFRNRGDLDFASHTMYLLSTYLSYPDGNLNFRLGSGMELAFSSEMAQSIEGFSGIMELQPGQINWGSYNAQPLPGAVKMWIWHSFGLGDKFTCTYRFRQLLFGGEQNHKGIMETDGITVSRGGKEFVQAIAEINSLKKYYRPDAKVPSEILSRKTAFLWKQDNLWEMQVSPHTQAWDTWQHYYGYYQSLKSMGVPVRFIQESDNFNPAEYPFLVAPAYTMVDSTVIHKWTKYVENGGNLILSCKTGGKDSNGHFPETLLQQPIWKLIGAHVDDYDQLPPATKSIVKCGDKSFEWNVWGEFLTPDKGTETLAIYADQYYAGTSAAITRKLGKGTVTYIGVWTDKSLMERSILQTVYRRAGAKIFDLPNYAFVEWRDGFWVGVNYTSNSVTLPITDKSIILIGNKEIKPGEVAVWKD